MQRPHVGYSRSHFSFLLRHCRQAIVRLRRFLGRCSGLGAISGMRIVSCIPDILSVSYIRSADIVPAACSRGSLRSGFEANGRSPLGRPKSPGSVTESEHLSLQRCDLAPVGSVFGSAAPLKRLRHRKMHFAIPSLGPKENLKVLNPSPKTPPIDERSARIVLAKEHPAYHVIQHY